MCLFYLSFSLSSIPSLFSAKSSSFFTCFRAGLVWAKVARSVSCVLLVTCAPVLPSCVFCARVYTQEKCARGRNLLSFLAPYPFMHQDSFLFIPLLLLRMTHRYPASTDDAPHVLRMRRIRHRLGKRTGIQFTFFLPFDHICMRTILCFYTFSLQVILQVIKARRLFLDI